MEKKRLVALVLAVYMLMSMTVALSEAIGSTGVSSTTATSITIPKTIDLNGTLASVYSPNVTYTFSLAPVDPPAGATITSTDSSTTPATTVTSVVTKGVADGAVLASSTITFTSAETSTSADVTQNLTVNTDITKFTKPGVYRYQLKDETTAATLNAAGITRPSDYTNTYYLDVYVRNGTTGLEVYGYVLSKENNSKSGITADKKVGKIDDDKYYTVDVSLTKEVTGAMGDKNHEFPFAITLTNNSLYYHAKENAVPTLTDDTNQTKFTVNLKDGETYYMYGLSPLATVIYQETNDTADTYEVTITGASSTISAESSVTPSGTKDTGSAHAVSNYATSATQTITVDSDYSAVKFTNNLDEVSPTGLVLRFAPYVAMLIGGVALLAIMASKRRKHNDED